MTGPVVYIDDERNICAVLGALLRLEGIDAVMFTSAREALEFLRAHDSSVVVCDYRMPEMTGLELLARLERQVPFYLVTGELATDVLADGHPRVLGVLQKPLAPETLVEILRRHL